MLEDLLRKGLLAALENYGVFEEDVEIDLEKPRERSHGDLSTNLALVLGSRLGRKPRELAGEIAARVGLPKDVIESVEIAGPGFINFRIARPHQVKLLLEVLDPEGSLQDIKTGGNKRINVEFISANPTGPLNVVSARAGAFGMTLVRLLDAIGYDAHAEYYVNDAGRQVSLLGASLRAHYLQLVGEADPVPRGRLPGPLPGDHGRRAAGADTAAIKKAATAFDDESFQRVARPRGQRRGLAPAAGGGVGPLLRQVRADEDPQLAARDLPPLRPALRDLVLRVRAARDQARRARPREAEEDGRHLRGGGRDLVPVHRLRRREGPGAGARRRRAHLLPGGHRLPLPQVPARLRARHRLLGPRPPRLHRAHAGRHGGPGHRQGLAGGADPPAGDLPRGRPQHPDVQAARASS